MTDYKPGTFFVVDVKGRAGWFIGWAQALVNDASRYKHAGAIIDEAGTTVEAEPNGARYGNISDYAGRGLLISDGPIQQWLAENPGADEAAKRAQVVAMARTFVGTPYSFLDYLSIAGVHITAALPKWLQWPIKPIVNLLRRYVASTKHVLCSQLVDATYERCGIHLFQGKIPGDVAPADLAAYAEDREQAHEA